jgi:hypothetical protein
MPESTTAQFIRRTPTSHKTTSYPVRVQRTTDKDLQWWDRYAKPMIDLVDPPRPDADWDWWLITSVNAGFALMLGQHPECFSVVTDAPKNKGEVVCGLIQLVGRYDYLPDNSLKSVYVWYLSTVPLETLQLFFKGAAIPKLLGQLALDVGVTRSFQQGWKGRTGLYADDAGAGELLDFYTNLQRCGMSLLSADQPLPSAVRGQLRPNN